MPVPTGPVLFGPDFDRDPSPAYDWLRGNSPVHRVDFPGGAWAWLITRYADAVAALNDPMLVKSPAAANAAWRRSGMGLPLDHRPSLASHMTNADPPDLDRLRQACAGTFGARRMKRLRDRTQVLTDELLDRFALGSQRDLIDAVAYPLPIAVICDLVGVPVSLRAELRRWAAVIGSADENAGDQVLAATNALDALVADVAECKRRAPGADLTSDLLAQQAAGTLTADEVTSTMFLTLMAGHETTVGLLGTAALALATHPDLAAAVRDDPGQLRAFIEESLRLNAPLQNATWRFATEVVELGGQVLNPGDPVLVSLLAANRDAEVFAAPGQFRPGVHDRRHIAFGLGPHICIGSALARMEAEIVLGSLSRRFPKLTLAVPEDQLAWWPSPIMRGLYTLPVSW